MSLTCQQKEQLAVRSGKSFFWAGSNQALADLGVITLFVKNINDLETYIRSVIIDSDASEFSWQMYVGAEVSGGTPVNLHTRHEGISPIYPAQVVQDGTVDVQGAALFPDARTILGQTAPGNNSFMYQEVLTGGYIVPEDGGKGILFEFTNNSGSTVKAQILMSGRENI